MFALSIMILTWSIPVFSAPNSPAAYIDPSTGGMLAQVLAVALAALTGIIFFFSRQIKSGVARLRRKLRHEEKESEPQQHP